MLSKLCPAAALDNPRVLKALGPDSTGLPRVLGTGGYRSAPNRMLSKSTGEKLIWTRVDFHLVWSKNSRRLKRRYLRLLLLTPTHLLNDVPCD
jgi:hypothetical protein